MRARIRLLVFFVLIGNAIAQSPPKPTPTPLAPELAPLAAKHKADLTAVEKQREAALATYLPYYFAALDAAERNALTRTDLEAVAAVHKERDGVNAVTVGELLAAPFPENLPASLKTSRTTLFEHFKQIEAASIKVRQKVDADYLRALGVLKSRAAANPELARQIKAESEALLGNPVATADGGVKVQRQTGKLINTDFVQFDSKGVPVGWTLTANDGKPCALPAGASFQVLKENGSSFLRLASANPLPSGVFLAQDMDFYSYTKEIDITTRVRKGKDNGKGEFLRFSCFDAAGEEVHFFREYDFGDRKSWKALHYKFGGIKPTGAKRLQIRIGAGANMTGTLDFQRLEMKTK